MLVIQSRSFIVLIGFTGTIRSMAKWWLLVGFLSLLLSLKCIVLPISAMLVGIERQLMCCKRGTSSTSHACAANVYVDIRLPACIDPAKPDQNRRTTPPTGEECLGFREGQGGRGEHTCPQASSRAPLSKMFCYREEYSQWFRPAKPMVLSLRASCQHCRKTKSLPNLNL